MTLLIARIFAMNKICQLAICHWLPLLELPLAILFRMTSHHELYHELDKFLGIFGFLFKSWEQHGKFMTMCGSFKTFEFWFTCFPWSIWFKVCETVVVPVVVLVHPDRRVLLVPLHLDHPVNGVVEVGVPKHVDHTRYYTFKSLFHIFFVHK